MTSRSSWRRWIASSLASLVLISGAFAAPPDVAAAHPMIVAVLVNGHAMGDWSILRTAEGFHASAEAFVAWRLRLPEARPTSHAVPMYLLQGPLQARLDSATQSLAIDAPAVAFVSSLIDGRDSTPAPPSPPTPGGFLNYDARWAHDAGGDQFSGAVEAGLFSRLGVLTTTAVAREVAGRASVTRLETSFFRDDPATATSWRVGDAVGVASPWGRRMFFGGVQAGTKFATRPEMLLLPLPSLTGQALQPSVVDIYVNNVLSARREVQPGPFTLSQVPVLTGAGEVRMVVSDVLGREQVVNLSYYMSPELLRAGLHEFTWEAGAQRRNFGVASNDYGPMFASTTHRYGVNDQLTIDARAEVEKEGVAAGAGAVYVVGNLGTVAGGVAGSRSREGAGARGYAQVQRITRQWSVSARVEGATSSFRQAGMAEGELPPAFAAQLFGSLALHARQALSAGYIHTANRGHLPDIDLVNLGYTVQVSPRISASLTAFRSFSGAGDWGAAVNFAYSLDARRSLSGGIASRNGRAEGTAQLQQALPADTGFGYDLRANAGDPSGFGGRLLYQANVGNYGVEVTSVAGQRNFAADASGGIVTMGGHTMFTRRVQDSFAMVEVPGVAGVDIYSNNQRVATTNASGVGLVANLLSYQLNTVRIDDRGLPVELELDLAERIVAPYARSGVLASFAARRNDGATLRIVDEQGEPLPIGSEVRVGRSPTLYRVGRRGEVFVPEIAYPATIRAMRAGRPCSFIVAPPATVQPLPRLGPFTCRPIVPA